MLTNNALTPLLRFDSSIGRGDFVTEIGIGRLIRGITNYDETVVQEKTGAYVCFFSLFL
jgi:hypothetical protein